MSGTSPETPPPPPRPRRPPTPLLLQWLKRFSPALPTPEQLRTLGQRAAQAAGAIPESLGPGTAPWAGLSAQLLRLLQRGPAGEGYGPLWEAWAAVTACLPAGPAAEGVRQALCDRLHRVLGCLDGPSWGFMRPSESEVMDAVPVVLEALKEVLDRHQVPPRGQGCRAGTRGPFALCRTNDGLGHRWRDSVKQRWHQPTGAGAYPTAVDGQPTAVGRWPRAVTRRLALCGGPRPELVFFFFFFWK